MSSGVAGRLNGTLGMPTHTSVPSGRSICKLCSYARTLFAVQITPWAPSPEVRLLTSSTMSTSLKLRKCLAPSDRHNSLFFSPLGNVSSKFQPGLDRMRFSNEAYLSIARTFRPFFAAICTPLLTPGQRNTLIFSVCTVNLNAHVSETTSRTKNGNPIPWARFCLHD